MLSRIHFVTLLIAVHLSSQLGYAQKAPMKFGDIPKEDLEMAIYPLDTTASSLILGEYCNVSFEFNQDNYPWLKRQIHRRIKILKRAGFDQGDIKIPYYSGNNAGYLNNLKVEVHSPSGQVTKLSKADIFEEKLERDYSQLRFSCPNLQEGSVIEYQYEVKSKYIFQVPTWYFQGDIPTRWSELRIEIPNFYDYVFLKQGIRPTIEEVTESSNTYRLPLSGGSGGDIFTAKTLNLRLAYKDVPAMKQESFITTMDDYLTCVRFQLSTVQYPNSEVQRIISDWSLLAKDLMKDEDFGKRFSEKKNYGKIWDEVQASLKTITDNKEKVKFLYNFINSNFNLEEGNGIYANRSFSECYEMHTAQKKEMNLLMLGLLREAGIEAYPLLLSQRDNGKALTMYPFVQQFDHVMVLAMLGETNIVIDLGNKFRPIGYPGVNALNYEALLVQKDESQWVDITPNSASDTWFVNAKLDEEGSLNGKVKYSCEGYSAANERERCQEKPNGAHISSKVTGIIPDATLDSILIENENDLEKPFKVAFNGKLPNLAQVNGDMIYFTPIVFSQFSDNPFKTEKRDYAVDLPYPIKEQIILNLEIPEGYVLEDAPKPLKVATTNNNCKFTFQCSANGSKVQITTNLQINQLHFEPEEYPGLREFFSYVEEKLGSQLVLKQP